LTVFLEAEEERGLAGEKRGVSWRKASVADTGIIPLYTEEWSIQTTIYKNPIAKPHSTGSGTNQTRSTSIPYSVEHFAQQIWLRK